MLLYNKNMHSHSHTKGCKNCPHDDSVEVAQGIAQKSGLRWSETRTQVYQALLMAHKPVTAYELLDLVSKRYDRSTKPASVYRSLEALIDLGVIAKIESTNSYIACQNPECHHQHVFLICDTCGDTEEIADHGISRQLLKEAGERGFSAKKQILELHGLCHGCAQ